MFAAANQYISSKESSKPKKPAPTNDLDTDFDDEPARPSDVEATPNEPDDMLDDDLDLDGFDDLGLDDVKKKRKGCLVVKTRLMNPNQKRNQLQNPKVM